jgi:hypothetical protein
VTPDVDQSEGAAGPAAPVRAAVVGAHRAQRSVPPRPTPDWGRPAADSATARMVLAGVSLVSLVVGLTAAVLGATTPRWIGLLVFCTVGIGSAPWQLNAGLGLTTRLTLTGATALGAWTLPATVMVLTGWWHPEVVLAAFVLAAVNLHVIGLQRAWGDVPWPGRGRPEQSPPRTSSLPWWALAAAGSGTLLCLGSALLNRHLDPGFWGFLPRIGPAWYVGLALILVGFALSLGDDERPMAIAAVLLVVVLTLTPALVYDGPRAQSAYKHIDLVLQIRSSGVLHSSVSIYDAWPGFFAAMAWLSDVLGIRDSGLMTLATFWPPLLALFRLVALRALAGRVLVLPSQRWIPVVLAVLVDSLGADYFSPQSVGFVLGIAAFALALSNGLGHIRTGMLLVIGCTLAVSHQLSPFVVSGVLVLLALFRQVRPWWVPLLVLVPTVTWALAHLPTVLMYFSFDALGRWSNFEPPPEAPSPGLSRLPVVPTTVTALVVAVLTLGALALVALLRSWRDPRSWAIAAAPGVSLALVAVNPYGQEGIFRAVLFAIPWLAVLAALLFGMRQAFARMWTLATTLVLATAFLVASFGLDAVDVLRPADVAAVTYARDHGGNVYGLFYLGGRDLPDTLRRGPALLTRRSLELPPAPAVGYQPDQDVARLTEAYAAFATQGEGPSRSTLYALWSPTSAEYGSAYALQRPGEFAELRNALLHSPYWHVAFQRDGRYLFQLDLARYEADQAPATG